MSESSAEKSSAEKSSADNRAPDDDAARALDEALLRVRREGAGPRASEGERQRLDAVLTAIQPMLAKIPADAEMFDVGVTSGFDRDGVAGRPRLFLDMVAALECADEGYRLVRATRQGRAVVGEAKDVGGAVRLVADYVARRLVERERAMDGVRAPDAAPRRAALRETSFDTAGRPAANARQPRARGETAWRAREAAERAFPEPEALEEPDEPRRDRRAARFEPARANPDGDDWPAPDPVLPRRRDAEAPRDETRDARTVASVRKAEQAVEPERDGLSPAPAPNGLRARLAAARRRLTRWGAPGEPRGGVFERGLTFAVQFLGSAALTLVVAMVAWWAWKAAGFVK